MVRHKVRWILVRLDFFNGNAMGQFEKGHVRNSKGIARVSCKGQMGPITNKDIYQSLRESIALNFGPVGVGRTSKMEVRLFDEEARLAMIRIPVNVSGIVRASLTFLVAVNGIPLVASTISVNGSARTAKIAALAEMQRSRGVEDKKDSGHERGKKVGIKAHDRGRDCAQRQLEFEMGRPEQGFASDTTRFAARLARVKNVD